MLGTVLSALWLLPHLITPTNRTIVRHCCHAVFEAREQVQEVKWLLWCPTTDMWLTILDLRFSDSRTPPSVSKEPSPRPSRLKEGGCRRREEGEEGREGISRAWVRSWDHSLDIQEVSERATYWPGCTSPLVSSFCFFFPRLFVQALLVFCSTRIE